MYTSVATRVITCHSSHLNHPHEILTLRSTHVGGVHTSLGGRRIKCVLGTGRTVALGAHCGVMVNTSVMGYKFCLLEQRAKFHVDINFKCNILVSQGS